MKRIITVNSREGRFFEPSFILSENEDLEIVFRFPNEIRVGRYRVVVKHGKNKRTYTLGDEKTIVLPAQWLKENGTENVEFSLAFLNLSETAVIKDDYLIEPLKIQNIDGNFAFTPIIADLLDRTERLQKLYEEELAAKKEIFEKLKGYVDNGIEIPLEEIE